MGNATSKKPNRQRRARSEEQTDNTVVHSSSEDIHVDSGNKFDEQAISTIKKDLRETPELFVLNNILMSVMFFENYQKWVLFVDVIVNAFGWNLKGRKLPNFITIFS